ncbi:MAG: hypothetical protein HQ580_19235 [Planctomycetes bacterium]|nr:hypothetical protein [Planctomycetota bacterium]
MVAQKTQTLFKENPDWKKHNVTVSCPKDSGGCGWKGRIHELLVDAVDMENNTMWCPQCTSAGWVYN